MKKEEILNCSDCSDNLCKDWSCADKCHLCEEHACKRCFNRWDELKCGGQICNKCEKALDPQNHKRRCWQCDRDKEMSRMHDPLPDSDSNSDSNSNSDSDSD